ncbi:MAG: hypothetical protein ACRELD_11770, partial [Longimicrobiales bacterium]
MNRWAAAALELDAWMRERDYAGIDPFDLLASPLTRRAASASRWAGVALTQLGKRASVDARGALGIAPARNAKTIGLLLSAQARLAVALPKQAAALERQALEQIDWLDRVADRGGEGVAWGYPFPWANRHFHAPAGTPSAVATAFIGHGLLDAARAFDSDRARSLAADAARFIDEGLNRLHTGGSALCFSYTPIDARCVHNANVLAASLLARVAG